MPNRRFEMHQYRHILSRMRLGETDRQLAKAGWIGRKKAAALREHALREGWLNAARPLPEDAALAEALRRPTPRASSVSSVLAYQEEILSWREQGVQGVAIHQALVRKHGFTGHYSAVRRFLQQQEKKTRKPTVMLDFAPGEAAQVDFGAGPKLLDPRVGQVLPTSIFVMTLCWSRHQYAEIVTDQTVASWLSCHRRAFEFFGGVPSKVVIDNPKCAITRACYHDPEVQRSYAEFAEGYSFLISPCPPRDPQKKGIVESGVKYAKKNFLPLRDFRDLFDANGQLHEWVLGTAGQRLHGTTKEKPLVRFEAERAFLSALPDIPPELASWKKVALHGNCHVQFDKCFYSAPFRWIGEKLWLRAGAAFVRLYREHELVAVHPRLLRPGSKSTTAEHLPPEAVAYLMRDPQWCLKQAEAIGPATHALIQALFRDRVLDHLKAAQGVIRLGERFGTERLEAAAKRALDHGDPRYRTVKTILDHGLDQIVDEPAPDSPLAEPYGGGGRYCRDTRQMFLFP